MTTIRDVRDLVRPIVASRGDLLYFNRYVVFKPVRFGLRGLLFDRSSDPDEYDLKYLAIPLFASGNYYPGSDRMSLRKAGKMTFREKYPGDRYIKPERLDEIVTEPWLKSDPDHPGALREFIVNQALPAMERLVRPQDYLAEVLADQGCMPASSAVWQAVFIEFTCGNFDSAAKMMLPRRINGPVLYLNHINLGLGDRLEAMGGDLSMEDKRFVIAFLHKEEEQAIKFLKLEKHWQPAPFPAEEMGLV